MHKICLCKKNELSLQRQMKIYALIYNTKNINYD